MGVPDGLRGSAVADHSRAVRNALCAELFSVPSEALGDRGL